MKETKKKVKKQKQIMRGAKAPALSIDALKSKALKSHQQKQKQKQEQNVVVNINQPAKPKYKKRAQKAVQKNDDKQQQAYKGPIMAPTYNPPIVIREPASTQNELLAKLFETKQERENTTQPNLLVGARVPNVETRQEKAHNDLERVRGKRVAKLDIATAPLPATSELVHPEYQEATQNALFAFSAPEVKVKLGGRKETRYPSSSSLLDQLNLGEQPEAPEHSSHKAEPIVDLDTDILFSGEGQEGEEGEEDEAPLEPAQPLGSVSLDTLGQGTEELTAQLTTSSTPAKMFSSGEDIGLVKGQSKRADFGVPRGAHRSGEQIQLQKYIDANFRRGSENLERLKSVKSLTKTELITILNMPDGYETTKRILSEIGINYVPPKTGSDV